MMRCAGRHPMRNAPVVPMHGGGKRHTGYGFMRNVQMEAALSSIFSHTGDIAGHMCSAPSASGWMCGFGHITTKINPNFYDTHCIECIVSMLIL